jgi:NAD(P)-dependent dehydrogenase (short-subunit alcohol dehydrogenase family)
MAERPVAVITGATGGIGRAVAHRLAAEGYALVLLARREAPLVAVATDLQRAHPGGEVFYDRVDVTHPEALEAALMALPWIFGRLDLLVTAHGAAPVLTPSAQLTAAEMDGVWRTDVLGTLLACQAAARVMRAQGGGAMVLLTSLHAFQTYAARAPYAAAKAAVVGLMRSLALEWGPLGIRVNAVAPWQVDGERTDRFLAAAAAQGEDLRAAYLGKTPLRRLIQPEEVADTVCFLAHNAAMTGQCVILDAGVSASMSMHPFAEVPPSGAP